jgi:endonuclease III
VQRQGMRGKADPYVVAARLTAVYRDFGHNNPRNPLADVVFLMLSVQTGKEKYEAAYAALRKAFPSFAKLKEAPRGRIAHLIKGSGLAHQKAARIKGLLQTVTRAFGKPTLAPLRKMTDEQCEAFLTALPGVGKKVARCVMMCALDRDVFPVDTHCWRVCGRLGWRPTRFRACTPAAMDFLQDSLPRSLRQSLHVNLLSLGREFCLPRRPRCSKCPLLSVCPTGLRLQPLDPCHIALQIMPHQ